MVILSYFINPSQSYNSFCVASYSSYFFWQGLTTVIDLFLLEDLRLHFKFLRQVNVHRLNVPNVKYFFPQTGIPGNVMYQGVFSICNNDKKCFQTKHNNHATTINPCSCFSKRHQSNFQANDSHVFTYTVARH